MPFWRQGPDGSLMAPHRGKAEPCPDGYQVDPGDPFICFPVLPACVHRLTERRDTRCCKGRIIVTCGLTKKLTLRMQCLTCQKRPI